MVEITPTDGPGQFAQWKRNIERKIANLETMRRTPFTEIYDDDGDVLARFSSAGLQFLDSAGNVITDSDGAGLTVYDSAGNPLTVLDDTGVHVNDGSGNEITTLDENGVSAFDALGNLLAKLDTNGLFVQRADGTDVIVMGTFSDGVGTFEGTAIYDRDGRSMLMTRDDTLGLVKPEIPAVFRDPNNFTPVTSASFVTVRDFAPSSVYHDTLYVDVGLGSDAATTGQVRLRETIGGAVTSTLTTTAGTTQTARFRWLHGRVPGDDPGSQDAIFVIEARRTAGVGDINVYDPLRAVMTSSALVPSTANGNPVFL